MHRSDLMTEKAQQASPDNTAVFDIHKIAGKFPETADTMLIDTRLTDEHHASSRVFRVYRPTPAHYHATCDEYLLVVSGRATFFLGDSPHFEVGPGQLIFFKQGTVSRHPGDPRGAFRRSGSRHPAPRSQRHHLRQPRRRHTGEF